MEQPATDYTKLDAKEKKAIDAKLLKLACSSNRIGEVVPKIRAALVGLCEADHSYGPHLTMVYNLERSIEMLTQSQTIIDKEVCGLQDELGGPFGPKYAAASKKLEEERAARGKPECRHEGWRMKQNPAEGGKPTPWCDLCQRHCVPNYKAPEST